MQISRVSPKLLICFFGRQPVFVRMMRKKRLSCPFSIHFPDLPRNQSEVEIRTVTRTSLPVEIPSLFGKPSYPAMPPETLQSEGDPCKNREIGLAGFEPTTS
jgi:hypothetical protein